MSASLEQQLVDRARTMAQVLGRPRIARARIVDPEPSADRDAEFGLIVLDDGSAGLYYAWLGGEQAQLPQRVDVRDLVGRGAEEICQWFGASGDCERSIGIAAINALTTALYRRASYPVPNANDAFGGLSLSNGDHLGMVGNFPPLVRRARALGVQVTVVERKAHMVAERDGVSISLDPNTLARCNKIICSGATMLNASLLETLTYCADAEQIALVGPTVGFIPDDLFKLGINCFAGSEVVDGHAACDALERGQPLGALARRTVIKRDNAVPFEQLLKRVDGH